MSLRNGIKNYMTSKIFRKTSGVKDLDLGFTLTEILVSMIIAGLIMSGLMSLMVELVTSDARENSRNETQREMQMALDYISSDIRESVYVYDGNCLEGQTNTCRGFVNEIAVENSVPILAFWKLEDLPPVAAENNCGRGIPDPDLEFPCLSGRSYSLIIYYLTRNEEGNRTWSGLGRIRRARLAQFNSAGEPTGLIPPYGTDGVSFQTWTFSDHASGLEIRPITLVDFVDSRPMSEIAAQQEGVDQLTVTCPPSHIKTPSDNTLSQINDFADVRNFYACIRDDRIGDDEEDQTQAFNQKVILFLRGNAAGKPGIRDANIGFMPAIQTQVLNRSVRQKRPRTF